MRMKAVFGVLKNVPALLFEFLPFLLGFALIIIGIVNFLQTEELWSSAGFILCGIAFLSLEGFLTLYKKTERENAYKIFFTTFGVLALGLVALAAGMGNLAAGGMAAAVIGSLTFIWMGLTLKKGFKPGTAEIGLTQLMDSIFLVLLIVLLAGAIFTPILLYLSLTDQMLKMGGTGMENVLEVVGFENVQTALGSLGNEILRLFAPAEQKEVVISENFIINFWNLVAMKLNVPMEGITPFWLWVLTASLFFLVLLGAYLSTFDYSSVRATGAKDWFTRLITGVIARTKREHMSSLQSRLELVTEREREKGLWKKIKTLFEDMTKMIEETQPGVVESLTLGKVWEDFFRDSIRLDVALNELACSLANMLSSEKEIDEESEEWKKYEEALTEAVKIKERFFLNFRKIAIMHAVDFIVSVPVLFTWTLICAAAGWVVWKFGGIPWAWYLFALIILSFWLWRVIELVGRRLLSFVMALSPGTVQTIYYLFFFPEGFRLDFLGVIFFGFFASTLIATGVLGGLNLGMILAVLFGLGVIFMLLFQQINKLAPRILGASISFLLLSGFANSLAEFYGKVAWEDWRILAVVGFYIFMFDLLAHLFLTLSYFATPLFLSKLEVAIPMLTIVPGIEEMPKSRDVIENLRKALRGEIEEAIRAPTDRFVSFLMKATEEAERMEARIPRGVLERLPAEVRRRMGMIPARVLELTTKEIKDAEGNALLGEKVYVTDGRVVILGKGIVPFTVEGLRQLGGKIGENAEKIFNSLKGLLPSAKPVTKKELREALKMEFKEGLKEVEEGGRIPLGGGSFAEKTKEGWRIFHRDGALGIEVSKERLADFLSALESPPTCLKVGERKVDFGELTPEKLVELAKREAELGNLKLKWSSRAQKLELFKGDTKVGEVSRGELGRFIESLQKGRMGEIGKGIALMLPEPVMRTVRAGLDLGKFVKLKLEGVEGVEGVALLPEREGVAAIDPFQKRIIRGRDIHEVVRKVLESGKETGKIVGEIPKMIKVGEITEMGAKTIDAGLRIHEFKPAVILRPQEVENMASVLKVFFGDEAEQIIRDVKRGVAAIQQVDIGGGRKALQLLKQDETGRLKVEKMVVGEVRGNVDELKKKPAVVETAEGRKVRFWNEREEKFEEMPLEEFKQRFADRREWIEAVEEIEKNLKIEGKLGTIEPENVENIGEGVYEVKNLGLKVLRVGDTCALLDEGDNVIRVGDLEVVKEPIEIMSNRKEISGRGLPEAALGEKIRDISNYLFETCKGKGASVVMEFDTLRGRERIEIVKYRNGDVEVRRDGRIVKRFVGDRAREEFKNWLEGQRIEIAVKNEIGNVWKAINELKSRYPELENRIAAWENRLREWNSKIGELESKLENGVITREEFNEEMQKLREEVGKFRTQLEGRIKGVEEKVGTLEEEMEETKEWISDIERKMEEMEKKYPQLKGDIDKLRKDLEKFKVDVEKGKVSKEELEKAKSEIWTKMKSIQESVEVVTKAVSKVSERILDMERKLNKLPENLRNEFKAELEKAQAEFRQGLITEDDFNRKLGEIEEKIKKTEIELGRKIEGVGERVEKVEEDLEKLRKEVKKEIEGLPEKWREEIEERLKTVATKEEMEAIRNRVREIHEGLESVKSFQETFSSVIEEWKKRLDEMEGKVEGVEKLKGEVEKLEGKMNKIFEKIKGGEIELAEARKRIEEITGELNKVREEINELKTRAPGPPARPPTRRAPARKVGGTGFADRRVKLGPTQQQIKNMLNEIERSNLPKDVKEKIKETIRSEYESHGRIRWEKTQEIDKLIEESGLSKEEKETLKSAVRTGFVRRLRESYFGARAGIMPEKSTASTYDKMFLKKIEGRAISEKTGEQKRSVLVLHGGTPQEQFHAHVVELIRGYMNTGSKEIKEEIEKMAENTSLRQLELARNRLEMFKERFGGILWGERLNELINMFEKKIEERRGKQ